MPPDWYHAWYYGLLSALAAQVLADKSRSSQCRHIGVIPCVNVCIFAPAAQVLTNAGQANAATGDQGYKDALECAAALAAALGVTQDDVMLQSTGMPLLSFTICALSFCLCWVQRAAALAVALGVTDTGTKCSRLRSTGDSTSPSLSCLYWSESVVALAKHWV
jgi:N-acetylglutamate synthase/N-acetylornithine aminotransferase